MCAYGATQACVMTDPCEARGIIVSLIWMQSLCLALSADPMAVRAAWVEAHKALFPGNAVLRQQVCPESVGLMCLLTRT